MFLFLLATSDMFQSVMVLVGTFDQPPQITEKRLCHVHYRRAARHL